MTVLINLVKRNMKVFLRDKTSVFFSFLSVIIIISLYALFLGKVNTDSIKQQGFGNVDGIRFMVDSWIMAGVLIVSTITVTLGVFGIMIADESDKKLNGFLVAPISRTKIVIGYLITSLIVGTLINIVCCILAQFYIVINGGEMLPFISIMKVIGILVLSVFSFSCMAFFLVSFIKSITAFSALSAIIGSMIGFVTGIYVPISMFPKGVQFISKLVPATHATVLMRQVFLEVPFKKVFEGAPAQAAEDFKRAYGSVIEFGDITVTPPVMILYVLVSGLIFLLLSVLMLKRKKR